MLEDIHPSGLGPEHPYGDFVQFLMFSIFLSVWVVDSFIFRFSTLSNLIPLIFRLIFSTILFGIGGFLAVKSIFMVFGGRWSNELATTSVYSWMRHPMYLGGLLFFLGLTGLTFSLLSFVIWCCMIPVYDWLATYEEEELVRRIGEEYLNYQNEVSKWLPF